jgi:hypothetical protein
MSLLSVACGHGFCVSYNFDLKEIIASRKEGSRFKSAHSSRAIGLRLACFLAIGIYAHIVCWKSRLQ